MEQLIKGGPRKGTVTIPSSKSMAHRLLIAAMLSQRTCAVRLNALSDDILATAGCLQGLGWGVLIDDRSITVSPRKSAPAEPAILPCNDSGSTLRFLLPVAGAMGRPAVFNMSESLSKRPVTELTDVLKAHGMTVERSESSLKTGGKLSSGLYEIPGNISSQYITGLLFALPLLEGSSVLRVTGDIQSEDYVLMTEKVLEMAGIRLEKTGWEYHIPGGQKYELDDSVSVEGDWSNAAFFLCMGALSEEGIGVRGLDLASSQGDKRILDLLRELGAETYASEDLVFVKKGRLKGIDIDASQIPDLVPPIAALAALCEGTTRILNAERLRLKESDRLKTTAAMLRALGAGVQELEDGLIIKGKKQLDGGLINAARDHRIAMAAAVAASGCVNNVTISGAECVAKSYPAFWDHLDSLEEVK